MCEDHADPVEEVIADSTGYVQIISQLLHGYRCNVRPVSLAHFSSPWGIAAPSGQVGRSVTLTCFVMLGGQCYFQDERSSGEIRLQAGDMFVFRNDCANTLKDSPHSTTVPLLDILTPEIVDNQLGLTLGGGGKLTQFMTCFYVFKQVETNVMLDLLPRYMHVVGRNKKLPANIAEMVHDIHDEVIQKNQGWHSISDYLSRAMLVKVVRQYQLQTTGCVSQNTGLLLQDTDIIVALRYLHKNPGENWTVSSLANVVGMSRSAFAARFQKCMNQTPMAYLFEIRMHWACSLLRDQKLGIKRIAMQMGYSSDASFSSAFKRWAGISPGQYRKTGDLPAELRSNHYLRVLIDD